MESSPVWSVLQMVAALTLTPLNGPAPQETAVAPIPAPIQAAQAPKPATPVFWQPQLSQWRRVLDTHAGQSALYELCQRAPHQCPSRRVAHWQRFLDRQSYETPMRQLLAVNNYMNRYPYKQDDWLYGQSDYWANVQEFLEQSGDCEDFAIAKYFSLRQLGFPAEDMQILLVYDVYSGTDHAVLRVALDGNVYFLDNREDLIDRAGFEKRYRPHLAFNEADVHLYDQPLMARSIRGDDERIIPGNR